MSNPIAVLISDVHYTPTSLPLAQTAFRSALQKARKLGVPLVDAGDLLDSKAIIRAECANAIIDLLKEYEDVKVYLLVGNHTLLNEKGSAHSLNFLSPYANVVSSPVYIESIQSWLVPYFNDSSKLEEFLSSKPESGDRLIMHQGVVGADMGHYVKDTSSLTIEAYSQFRVISGHYHKAQDIKTGRPQKGAVGLFSYIGSPYTITAGEANDGPKGFQVLFDDGLLKQVPTHLRKHVTVECNYDEVFLPIKGLKSNDILWLKVSGPHSELEKLDKNKIGETHLGHTNFKFDKIPNDSASISEEAKENQSGEELIDILIDSSGETSEAKARLKLLWREVLSHDTV